MTYGNTDAAAVGSWIAAVAAIIGVIATAAVAILTKNQERNLTLLRDKLAYRRQQINELYGPLRMLRARSRLLWESLPGDQDWRLVQNISAVKSTPQRVVVDLIIATGDEVSTLLVDRAGLIEEGPTTTIDAEDGSARGPGVPGSFHQFLRHHKLLSAAWNSSGSDQQEAQRLALEHSFPRSLDKDIDTGYRRVIALLANLEARMT